MSWTGRFANLFRRDRLTAEIDEELASHLDEALAHGRPPADARRALGSPLHHRERSRDLRLIPWIESLAADAVFAWRQLRRNRAASGAAILSLALAIGATTAAFRLVDAVLWRKLPIADPDKLYYVVTTNIDREGRPDYREDYSYPRFRRHRELIGDRADLLVIGDTYRVDVSYGAATETEKTYRQHLSGNVFGIFGLQPALGRLLTPNDDVTPGAHPVAVISHDYWTRRFARDPAAVGKTFRQGSVQYQIVGVGPKGFTGTRPGSIAEVFIPAIMHTEALNSPGWSWFQLWIRPKPGFTPEQVRQPLAASLAAELQEQLKRFDSDAPQQTIRNHLAQTVQLLPAGSGASGLQRSYRQPLLILGVLVALVLLIACANTGNLLTAQATARAREMALRVSIGAGQSRLIQMVLVESLLLAAIASAAGMLFAWWSAPFVVSMLAPPADPVRLVLDPDWRVIGFAVALTLAVAMLFGLAPALRASAVKPMAALKGGSDPHARRRFMLTLVASQMAFCVLVQFVAGLFMNTFDRLNRRPLGFSPEQVLLIDNGGGPGGDPLAAERVRRIPGVESVATASWSLLSGNTWTSTVRVNGQAPDAQPTYFLNVSPEFLDTMRIGLVEGRGIRTTDAPPKMTADNRAVPGVGIVNEAFARKYFAGQSPVGRVFQVATGGKDRSVPVEVIGLMRDAPYRNLREPIRPTVFVPLDAPKRTLIVRTAGNPLALAPAIRKELAQDGQFAVPTIETHTAIVRRHMIRERLLAALSLFFAVVALVLAAVGLYGVLNYSVVQQRREIGIRIALGAQLRHVMWRVTAALFAVVLLGAAAGLAVGIASARFIEGLLYEVKPSDTSALTMPIAVLLAAAVVAALPPALRAARIDPALTLRAE